MRSREIASVHERSREIASVHERSREIASVHERLRAFTSVHERSREIASVHERSREIASVHERSREIASVHERSREIASVHERSREIASVYECSRAIVTGHLSMRDGQLLISACVCQSRRADGDIFLRKLRKCPQCPLESIVKVRILAVPGNSSIFSSRFSRAIKPVGERWAVHEEHEVSRRKRCFQARDRRLTLDGSTAPA